MFKKYSTSIIFVFSFLLCFWNYLGAIGRGVIDRELFYNSDAVYFPTLAIDILSNGARLSEWRLGPALYIFPDMLNIFAMWKIFADKHLMIWAYGVVQLLMLVLFVYLIYRELEKNETWIRLAGFVVLFSVLGQGLLPLDYNLWLQSAFHIGAYICTLALLWVVLLGFRNPSNKLIKCAQVVILFCILLSDQIIILQFVLPAIFVFLVMGWMKILPVQESKSKALFVFYSTLISFGIYKAISYFTSYYGIKANLNVYADNLQDLINNSLSFLIIGLVFLVLNVVVLWRMWKFKKSDSKAWFIALFLLVSMAANLVVLPSQLGAPLRYAFNIVYGPFLFLPFLLDQVFDRKKVGLALSGLCALLLFGSLVGLEKSEALANLRTYYPEEVRCLDEQLGSKGIRHGISGYWDAKRIAYTSKTGLQLAQMNMDEMKYHYWITNKNVFTDKYDFVIAHNTYRQEFDKTVEQLTADFGTPIEIIDCGVYKAMIYPPDLIASKLKSTIVKK
ncbi:hypothetical protein [Bdellovibrio sp. GT3]|uniref:hypothetical protein n=1 Tax=Bdellovibrio sp. GT3 TaxID=3136282 RepID=UPI0030EFA663